MTTLDETRVHEFLDHMQIKYKTTFIPRLGEVKDLMEVLIGDKAKVLPHEFAITLGEYIFTSFNIYRITPKMALKAACHEFTHAIQIARVGEADFYSNYVIDANQRAMYEIEAYAAGFEIMILCGLPITHNYLEFKAHQIATLYRMPEQEQIIADGFKRNLLHDGFSRTVQDWREFNVT